MKPAYRRRGFLPYEALYENGLVPRSFEEPLTGDGSGGEHSGEGHGDGQEYILSEDITT